MAVQSTLYGGKIRENPSTLADRLNARSTSQQDHTKHRFADCPSLVTKEEEILLNAHTSGWMKEYTTSRIKTKEKRFTDGITTYNAAHMSLSRAYTISEHYRRKIVCVQSTTRESDEDVYTENTTFHKVYHFPACRKTHYRQRIPSGCAILVPRSDTKFISKIGVPTNKH